MTMIIDPESGVASFDPTSDPVQQPDGSWLYEGKNLQSQIPGTIDPATGQYRISNADYQKYLSNMQQWALSGGNGEGGIGKFMSSPAGPISLFGGLLGAAGAFGGAAGTGSGVNAGGLDGAYADAGGGWANTLSQGGAVANTAPAAGANIAAQNSGSWLDNLLNNVSTGNWSNLFSSGLSTPSATGGISSNLASAVADLVRNGADQVQVLDFLNQQGISGATAMSAANAAVNGGGVDAIMAASPAANGVMSATGAGVGGSPFQLSGGQILGSAASNLLGAGLNANAIKNAANTQAQAAAAAGNTQLQMFNQALAAQAPWQAAGTAALGQELAGVQPGGQFNKPYTLADFQKGPQSGLYDFAKGQALGAMNNQAAAGGQTQSTGAQVGAAQLAGNLANQYYNTGFNQNQATNAMALNSLQSLANQGQTAANQVSGLNTGLGNNLANLTVQGGNVNAAGQVGSANAYGNALSSIGNTLSTPNAMQTLANLFA